jgi:hypothetical protein
MGILNALFGKKINLQTEMKITAEKFINADWFKNCGNEPALNVKYKMEKVQTLDEVEKKLAYKKDVKGFVTLDNLFIEAGRRSQLFLSLYHKNEIERTWNKLTDLIVKTYIATHRFDFNAIEERFNSRYGIETNLYIRRIFIETLREIYFKNLIENYPTFFVDASDVYLSGNVIIGWLGKFASHNAQVKEIFPILSSDGILNIW